MADLILVSFRVGDVKFASVRIVQWEACSSRGDFAGARGRAASHSPLTISALEMVTY